MKKATGLSDNQKHQLTHSPPTHTPYLPFSCFVHQNKDQPWWLAALCPTEPRFSQKEGMRRKECGGTRCCADTHSPAGLVVVQVHHDAGALVGAPLVNALTLPGVHKLLGKAISVLDVVPAASPQPVPGQILGPRGTAAAAGGQLTLPAGAAHGVDHAGRTHRVRERRLPAACTETQVGLGDSHLSWHTEWARRTKALQSHQVHSRSKR